MVIVVIRNLYAALKLNWLLKKRVRKKGLLLITLALQAAVTNIYHDNICISNAQYYEPGARGYLWCEILEF